MISPRIEVAKCAICHEGISRLHNDDIWMHNLGGFRADGVHEPTPAPETIRPLEAYPLMGRDA